MVYGNLAFGGVGGNHFAAQGVGFVVLRLDTAVGLGGVRMAAGNGGGGYKQSKK